jgi:hypothetical protein
MDEIHDHEDQCESCGNVIWACELTHCTGLTPMASDEYDPNPEDDI